MTNTEEDIPAITQSPCNLSSKHVGPLSILKDVYHSVTQQGIHHLESIELLPAENTP